MNESLSRHRSNSKLGTGSAERRRIPFRVHGWTWRLLGAAGFTVLLVLVSGCGHAPVTKEKKAVTVVVTQPVTDTVLDYQDFTGRLDAIHTVDLRPRVSGYVVWAIDPKKEGKDVHKGDLLFQIEPKPFEVDLAQAEANVKLAEADRHLAERNVARARRLLPTGAVTQEEYDVAVATVEKATAQVAAQKATREKATIMLGYTRVVSPIDGQVSRRNVDPGNLVNADSTLLTTIIAENPVYAYFDVDERTYLELLKVAGVSESSSWFKDLEFPIVIRLANEEEFTHKGKVNFKDNRINANTGTIRMRGVFDNSDGKLKSGLFARIRLPIGNPYSSLLIPDEALQSDQGKKFVWVVKADEQTGKETGSGEVEYRQVTLGQAIGHMRVIKEGLARGERVIVAGMQQVRAKQKVKFKQQPTAKPPTSPLTQLFPSRPQDNARKQPTTAE